MFACWGLLLYPVAMGFNIIMPSSSQNRNQLFANSNIHEDNDVLFSRNQFVSIILSSSSVILIPGIGNSFEGGVGGLGK